MTRTSVRLALAGGLLLLGWAAGRAQPAQPDFEIVVDAPSGARADELRRDGNWWDRQQPVDKITYMLGIFDGTNVSTTFGAPNLRTDSTGKATAASTVELRDFYQRYNAANARYFKSITVGQVVDGVNKFYKDSRNKGIVVWGAVRVVIMQIAGDDTTQITLALRQLMKK